MIVLANRAWRPAWGLALLAVLAIVPACSTASHPAAKDAKAPPTTAPAPPSLVASLTSWQLGAPISRPVVLPQGNNLVILGGLDAAGSSASGVFSLVPQTGQLSQLGSLVHGVHDAAGAFLAGKYLVFGGGSPTTTARVQSFSPSGQASAVGQLPQPRSDLVAVTVGSQAYLMGGYDGTNLTPGVLATSDGSTFKDVAQLPAPGRYEAAAALGQKIYVFGGETGTGQLDAIQEIDLATQSARIVGHLPAALSHASAVTLGGSIYILGGRLGSAPTNQILKFNPADNSATVVGTLPLAESDTPAVAIGDQAWMLGGEGAKPLASAINLKLESAKAVAAAAAAEAKLVADPFTGHLLIADRGNNRIILVDKNKNVLWTYPSATAPPPTGSFYFPDDAFFIRHGTAIISNQENNNTIVQIAYPSGKILWSYGHPHVAGSGPGYLNQPDDAYLLKNGQVAVADAKNCRIIFINPDKTIASQIGTVGNCQHNPPTSLGYPNGDTPLANGNVLISEINGSWVSEYTPSGTLVWTVQLPIAYPSDPQQIGPDLYLIADYSKPGGIYEFNRAGQILWSYHPASGPGMLDHPSLAERLPNGLIAANDDYRDRVVIINPATGAIVWQYGMTDIPGTGPDQLKTPDGFDLLTSSGQTPTHPQTG
ncbi:MAG: outer membrane protein assembly factor BamB family protein [Acidimicrobiales bacterium]